MLPELSAKQIEALEQFRDLRIGFEELRASVAPLVVYTMDPYGWRVEYKASLGSVRVEMAQIEAAKAKLQPAALRYWAMVLLLTDAYDWEGEDEDAIADELNRLAWG
jgi:hypothetical protein